MTRNFPDFVEAFEDLTSYTGSPARLRRWAAISAIAGALERKVWVKTKGRPFYPGMYIILVSPPGVGKSEILMHARRLWEKLEDHKLSATSVSKASLIDDLHDAHRVLIHAGKTPPTTEFNSLIVSVSELGVFLPEFANEFMNVLTDIYDGHPYKERKRTKNLVIDIPKPQINLLTGTTPGYLTALLPEGAWDQGFMSRTMMIYAGEQNLVSLFAHNSVDPEMEKKVQQDLKRIGNLYGQIEFTVDAMQFIDEWYLNGQEPRPDHPKLQHYLTRRPGHLLKLAQVACVSESDTLEIAVRHVQQAMDWLVDAETAIPEIFKAMTSGGDGKVMDEAWHMLFRFSATYAGKGAPHSMLIEFLSRRVPSHSVERIIDLMDKSGMIRAVAEKGGMQYFAKERKQF